MHIEILQANLDDKRQAADVLELTDVYSRDVMGMEEPLSNAARINLIKRLKKFPTFLSLLAYKDGEAVGLANCFVGFSTFEARKIINIHDLVVVPMWRGLGIGRKLLEAVQQKAIKLDCCKITLEVREDNPAMDLYERFGFESDDPKMHFLTKELY